MGSTICLEQTVTMGEKTFLDSVSPRTHFAVVFEDDGQTGYFYGLDNTRDGQSIVDALHVYNVESVVDKANPSLIQLVWSDDGLKAALLINEHPHAVFDFQAKRGWCRTGFPPPKPDWSSEGHEWDERAMELFT